LAILKFGWRHKLHLTFHRRFLHAKIISTKMTYHPFSKSFCFKKNIFSPVTFGDNHDSTWEWECTAVKLHTSKYVCLNKNIISPAVKTDLIDDFRIKKYAIMLDESTDISTQKHLCMFVRFVGDKRKEIVTGLVGLIPVQEATGKKNSFD
jgi:hypothetical protein